MASRETGPDVLDWIVPVAQVPGSGKRLAKEATETERAAFAAAAGIESCERLTAEFMIEPLAGGTYRVRGHARATITQACVVTLEPVAARLDEPLLVDFRSGADTGLASRHEIDLEEEAEVEPIENAALAIGRVVYECLASAIEPYPRKADAVLASDEPKTEETDKVRNNPFAVLAGLKPKPPGAGA